jgi:hypothetical protein
MVGWHVRLLASIRRDLKRAMRQDEALRARLRRQNGAGSGHTAADHPVTGTHWLHEPLILPGSANPTLGFGLSLN